MIQAKQILTTVVAGMPLWAWAIVGLLTAINEAVNRSKSTRAQSLLQWLASVALQIPMVGTVVLAKFPVIGSVLRKMAVPPAIAAAPAPRSSGQSGRAAISLLLAIAGGVALAMALGGCGAFTLATVFRDGVKLASCAPADYAKVMQALYLTDAAQASTSATSVIGATLGWLDVALQTGACIQPVIQDIEAAAKGVRIAGPWQSGAPPPLVVGRAAVLKLVAHQMGLL